MDQKSQTDFNNERFKRLSTFKKAFNLTTAGQRVIYGYDSLAIQEEIKVRESLSKIPIFHPEYDPDFTQYQYDLRCSYF